MVWKIKVQQRVKVFLWVMAHGKLLTNLERWRRKMASCSLCERCSRAEEGVLHTIRDCKPAKEVWESLIPPDLVNDFFPAWFEGMSTLAAENGRWEERNTTLVGDDGNGLLVAVEMEE